MNLVTDFEQKLNVQTSDMPGLGVQFDKGAYKRIMLDNAKKETIYNNFGQSVTLGKGQGKMVTFNRMAPLPTALTPLVEGVTPSGNSLQWSSFDVMPNQYGDYITVSDIVDFAAYDPQAASASKALGNQAGETLDEVTGLAISAGLNVQYSGGVTSRAGITDCLSVKDVENSVRTLKRFGAKKINGSYICIIHPDVSFDLMQDPRWQDVKTYNPQDWYDGEIGRIAGVRFIENSNAIIFHGGNILNEVIGSYGAIPSLQITALDVPAKTLTVFENIDAAQATALAGKKVKINGVVYTINTVTAGTNGTAMVTLTENITTLIVPNSVMYAGVGAANGKDVYSTLVFGQDAYGRVSIGKNNFEMITKGLGSGGTADPLNQRSTIGWKASHTAIITTEEHIVRIESVSSYDNK